jgi:hypothetical protein
MAEKKYFRQGRTRLVEGEGVDPSIIPQTFEEFEADQARPGAQGIEEYFENQLSKAEERVADAEKNRADNPSKASQAELTAAKAALETAQNSLTTLTDLTDVSKIDQLKILRENKIAQEEQTRYEDKPTEDPGEGNFWSYNVKEGRWKKVKGFQFGSDIDYGDGTKFGDGSFGDGSFTGPTGTPTKTYTAPDGRIFSDLASYNAYITKTAADEKTRKGQSAYDLLFSEFDRYGLGALIEPLKGFIQDGLSEAEFTLRLRDTDAYKKRFAANQVRIKNGLRALSEAEYILEEDKYQDVMRRYGLPESYYTRGDMGRQEGFEKLIGGDVSPVELEDRIQTAQNRVVNANPEVSRALREFYPEITGGDILAYALDPSKAIENIKRKVGAAEIGAGAMQAGLKTGLARAEELQRYGVTKETAQQGFGTIASGLERGRQLSSIYQQPTYTQEVAETEVFALPDAEKARRQRRRLGQLETATFSGTTGMTSGALDRERAGQY